MPANHTDIEKRLWAMADELRANSRLKASEFSLPVLGLIFLRYADHKFGLLEQELAQEAANSRCRQIGALDYKARGGSYLPQEARLQRLLDSPRG